MKVLHINTHDIEGGAAKGVYWLHKALLEKGVDSKMLVLKKATQDNTVTGPSSKAGKLMAFIRPNLDDLPKLLYKNRTGSMFSPAWVGSSLISKINQINPDIVHLHWVQGGQMSVSEIAKLRRPVVWTLRDMWPFTGGCHYAMNCTKYEICCKSCPELGASKSYDLSTWVFRRKLAKWGGDNVTLVPISSWLASCASSSAIFKNYRISTISNGISLKNFSPIDKAIARRILKLPENKTYVAFGAIKAVKDSRKGHGLLLEALKKFRTLYDGAVGLLVFGADGPESVNTTNETDMNTHYFGYLHDEIALNLVYNAADVMAVPSIQEAFGKTAAEAMACGTPVVAFDKTGVSDIVDHRENGYLAERANVEDFANGLLWIVNHPQKEVLRSKAREKAEASFDVLKIADEYMSLYSSLVKSQADMLI